MSNAIVTLEPKTLPASVADPDLTFSNELVALTRPDSVQAESFRALRSNLLAQHVRHGRRALAVCAPSVGAGCTFVAANLAMTMAQAGMNTLLIDGNMRAPAIQNFITPMQSLPGLADCLADDALPLPKALTSVQPNLSVLYAGNVDVATFDRLGAPVYRHLMDQCLRDFELTIIDTPPSSQFADARRIASVTRYAIVVACRQRSFVHDVQVLLDEIDADGGRAIGTYLNDY